MEFSITYSDVLSADGTFDATNNNEFVALAMIDPDNAKDWSGLWVAPGAISGKFGVFERNINDGTGIFANGFVASGSGTIRYGSSTSPWTDGSITITVRITKATDDAMGSIEVSWNGSLVATYDYSAKVFPKFGMYSRGVSAKVTNVSYALVGVKSVHEHTEEILPALAKTCTTDGLTEGKKCSVCGMTLVAQETIPASHEAIKTEAVAPTCTTAGNVEYWTCADCGKIFSDEACTVEITDTVAPATGHDTIKTDAAAPTCTAEGNIAFWFCGNCSKIFSDEACTTEVAAEDVAIAALGHTEETLAVVAPTCTETGLTEGKKCTVCNETLVAQEEVAALGHTEETLAAVAPTCTETGLTEGKKCTVCNETLVAQEEVAALGHTEETLAAVAPTCTETGLTEGKKCSVCNETLVAQEEVAALGHTEETLAAVAPTCTETGLTEGKKCSVCDTTLVAQEEVPATGHEEGDWIVDKEAEVGVAGSQHKECTKCHETLETEEIPALEAPASGCIGSVDCLPISAMLLALGSIVYVRRRKED